MPAGSEPADRDVTSGLPRTFRPLGVRVAISVFGTLLVAVCVAAWLAFPPHIRAEFTVFQRLTLLAVGGALAAAGHALARSRLVARTGGLTVVNGYRTRRYEWAEVLAVSLRPGSPWATLDLSDGTSVAAMGIQGSDGPRAARQVKDLRALVEAFTRTNGH